MIPTSDYMTNVLPTALTRKVNPAVTIKKVNADYLKRAAQRTSSNPSNLLDAILDMVRSKDPTEQGIQAAPSPGTHVSFKPDPEVTKALAQLSKPDRDKAINAAILQQLATTEAA